MTRATRRHPATAAAADLAGWKIRWGTNAAQDQAIQVVSDWLTGIAGKPATRTPAARAASSDPTTPAAPTGMPTKDDSAKPAKRASGGVMAGKSTAEATLRTGKAEGKRPAGAEPVKVRTTKAAADTPKVKAAREAQAAAEATVAAAHAADDPEAHQAAIAEYTAAASDLGDAIQEAHGHAPKPKASLAAAKA